MRTRFLGGSCLLLVSLFVMGCGQSTETIQPSEVPAVEDYEAELAADGSFQGGPPDASTPEPSEPAEPAEPAEGEAAPEGETEEE